MTPRDAIARGLCKSTGCECTGQTCTAPLVYEDMARSAMVELRLAGWDHIRTRKEAPDGGPNREDH